MAAHLPRLLEAAGASTKEAIAAGVPAFGAIQRLPKLIGYGHALELALSGGRFDEKEAQALGLLTAVAEEGRVVEEALALAAKIASRPPEALRYLKLSFAAGVDGQTAAGLHGLISEACHRDPVYQSQISRFARTGSARPPKSEQNA